MTGDNDWIWSLDVKIPSAAGAGRDFLDQICHALEQAGWSPREIFGIRLAVEEALVNAIRHGNAADNSKLVHAACGLNSQRMLVDIADEGKGFDELNVPDCTCPVNRDRASGRGIFLMRSYMSRVEYFNGGCRVLMEKVRQPTADTA